MTKEGKFPGTVLFVDDDKGMRELFVLVADVAGINNVEVFEDAGSAGTRLKTSEETIAAVFSDGLDGGWRQVIAAAKEADVPAFVLSTDDSLQGDIDTPIFRLRWMTCYNIVTRENGWHT